jgi:hypothetical protein
MKFSLINVTKEVDGLVDGYWLQNKTGTLEEAIVHARGTEKANSNRITVAVVEDINRTCPQLDFITKLVRLD